MRIYYYMQRYIHLRNFIPRLDGKYVRRHYYNILILFILPNYAQSGILFLNMAAETILENEEPVVYFLIATLL